MGVERSARDTTTIDRCGASISYRYLQFLLKTSILCAIMLYRRRRQRCRWLLAAAVAQCSPFKYTVFRSLQFHLNQSEMAIFDVVFPLSFVRICRLYRPIVLRASVQSVRCMKTTMYVWASEKKSSRSSANGITVAAVAVAVFRRNQYTRIPSNEV